jgi:hypothetical protein
MFDSSKMTREVALLYETASVAHVSARAVAADLGIAFNTVYGWYEGRRPLRAHVHAIKAVTGKIAAEHPEPEMEEIAHGLSAAKDASWVTRDNDVSKADAAINAELAFVFGKLMAKAAVHERPAIKAAWPGFGEVAAAMRRHRIKFAI